MLHRPVQIAGVDDLAVSPKIWWVWAVASSLAMVLAATGASGQCQYQVTVIQAPECPIFGFPPTFGTGINNLGHVVGYHCDCGFLSSSDDAFVWTPESGLVTLSFPAGTIRKRAFDINDAGYIVGEFDAPDDGLCVLGFLRRSEDFIVIRPPAGPFSQPRAINSMRQVVGTTADGTPNVKAFLWENGLMSFILPTYGPRSYATDINELGQVVGYMGTGAHIDAHTYLWDQGEMIDLGQLPGAFSTIPFAINDSQQIAGLAWLPDPGGGAFITRAFLWTRGRMINLGTLPGCARSQALDLNNAGQIVGDCSKPRRAFIWQNGVMHDLNDLTVPESDIVVIRAFAINENGQIAGTGAGPNGAVAVLLTPIERPLGDLDIDCRVRVPDLLTLLAAWGPCSPKLDCPADLNNDGTVNQLDLVLLIENWG